MHLHSRLATALVLASLISLGCSGKYDSPETCFRTLQVAAHNKDMPAVCECLTIESQETLTGMLIMSGSMMKMMMPDLGAVLEKHGLTTEVLQQRMSNFAALATPTGLRELASAVKDKPAFIADMFEALRKSPQGAEFSNQFEQQLAGELQDVKVDGDQATAVVVTTKGKDPISFRKTATGWKLHIDAPDLASAPAMPPA